MNKKQEEQFDKMAKIDWWFEKNCGFDIGCPPIRVKAFISKALKQQRKEITSIVQKEIAKSDKYSIASLERIRIKINK